MTITDSPTLPPTIAIHGIPVHHMTESQCVTYVLDSLANNQGGWVVTANLDHLRRLVKDSSYKSLCQTASLVVADGMPLIWASKIQKTPLPERVAGSNLIWSLTRAAAANHRSIFLLGGVPGTADGAAAILRAKFPQLKIAGTHCPPYGFERDPAGIEKIISALEAAKPDIIYVALGSPKQEQLAARLREQLPMAWWLGVGISFSFVTGDMSRAPKWMQRIGLEWLHRLMQEPKRLSKRYLIDDLPFAVSLLANAARRRWSRATKGAVTQDR